MSVIGTIDGVTPINILFHGIFNWMIGKKIIYHMFLELSM